MKSQLTGKDSEAGKDLQEEKGVTEDQPSGHEFEQTPGDSEAQASLASCSLRNCRAGQDLTTKQQLMHP